MSVQRTIAEEARLSGIGLHSGEAVNVVFKPAPPESGIVFVRVDLPESPSLVAHPDRLCRRMRRTAMAQGEVEVHTTEHLLAAAAGLGIDNIIVELDAVELPGLDGSALGFVQCLRQAGIVPQDVARRSFTLENPVAINAANASIVALPYHDGLKITYTLDDHGGVFKDWQTFEIELDEETFVSEVAPARTFFLLREVEMARAVGLGKGANTENTCIFDENGVIDNELRFPDEPVRHKVLDLIGDLAMARRRLNAHIIAVRSGHQENMALVQKLNRQIIETERPPYVFDIKEILRHLPHRYPILMVDRIAEYEAGQRIVGLKNVSINEPYFSGHFPENPVMPGVLQVEAMAQTGAVLLLTNPEYRGKIPLFMSMDRVKFRRPVYPGDQLHIEVEAMRIRNRMFACRGRVLVEGKLCAEAEIRSILVDRED